MAETKESKKPQRRTYRLLAGAHMSRDYSAKPVKFMGTNPETGEQEVQERYPSKTYTQGQVFEAEQDLIGLFGNNKFQEVVKRGRRYEVVTEDDDEVEDSDHTQKADPTPLNAQAPRTAPHGQVYQGHPATSGAGTGNVDPGSGVRQYAQTPEEAKEVAERHSDRLPQPKSAEEKARGNAMSQEEAAVLLAKGGEKGTGRKAKGAARSRPSQEEEADFHSMKKDELVQYAHDNEVDLQGATTKEEIIKALEKKRR